MRKMLRYDQKAETGCMLWIAVCFSLTSAVYLSWLYRLLEFISGTQADLLTMGGGYLLQAAGAGVAAVMLERLRPEQRRQMFYMVMAAYSLFSVPAILGGTLAGVLIFGLLSQTLCGAIAALYLYVPAACVPENRRGLVFGGGYGIATILIWLLSMIGGNRFLHTHAALIVYLLLAMAAVAMGGPLLCARETEAAESEARERRAFTPQTLIMAGLVVFLLSLVKNLGFSFPSADLGNGMSLELSRVFYAIGLTAAGLISDRKRKYGAECTVAALTIPFVMLALTAESVSGFICWSLDYLFYGFFSVFRVVLFLDIAAQSRRWQYAPLGLLAGRVGDTAGTAMCILLSDSRIWLIGLTVGLFILTVFLFFRLYQVVYTPEAVREKSEREIFETFSLEHDLSVREREVLRLVLAEQSNTAIAETLFVSESTIKYHVHNLLQKTGCKSRVELINKFHTSLWRGER